MKHATVLVQPRNSAHAHNMNRTQRSGLTVTDALKDEVSAYCRSGAVDACECAMIAMEQVARRFHLTYRQCERLFTELA